MENSTGFPPLSPHPPLSPSQPQSNAQAPPTTSEQRNPVAGDRFTSPSGTIGRRLASSGACATTTEPATEDGRTAAFRSSLQALAFRRRQAFPASVSHRSVRKSGANGIIPADLGSSARKEEEGDEGISCLHCRYRPRSLPSALSSPPLSEPATEHGRTAAFRSSLRVLAFRRRQAFPAAVSHRSVRKSGANGIIPADLGSSARKEEEGDEGISCLHCRYRPRSLPSALSSPPLSEPATEHGRRRRS